MPATSIPWAVQQALYAKLTAALGALSPPVPVFDHVPQDQAAPFVEIGALQTQPADYLAENVSSILAPIGVVSEYQGQKEAHQINAEIYAALHDKPLTLSAGAVVRMAVQHQDVARDGDGKTYSGSTIVSILVEH